MAKELVKHLHLAFPLLCLVSCRPETDDRTVPNVVFMMPTFPELLKYELSDLETYPYEIVIVAGAHPDMVADLESMRQKTKQIGLRFLNNTE